MKGNEKCKYKHEKEKKKEKKKLYIIDDQVRECVYVREKFLNFSLFFFFFCFVSRGSCQGEKFRSFEKETRKRRKYAIIVPYKSAR